jgi:hypothetical protein
VNEFQLGDCDYPFKNIQVADPELSVIPAWLLDQKKHRVSPTKAAWAQGKSCRRCCKKKPSNFNG